MGYNICCFQIKVKIKENESTQKYTKTKSSEKFNKERNHLWAQFIRLAKKDVEV